MIRCVLFRNGCWGLERLVATIRCSSRGPEPMCAAHDQLVLSCIGSPGELMPSSGLFWHPQTHGFQHVYWKNQGETAFWTSGIKSSLKFYQGTYLICQCTAKQDTTDWVIGIKQNDALLFLELWKPNVRYQQVARAFFLLYYMVTVIGENGCFVIIPLYTIVLSPSLTIPLTSTVPVTNFSMSLGGDSQTIAEHFVKVTKYQNVSMPLCSEMVSSS